MGASQCLSDPFLSPKTYGSQFIWMKIESGGGHVAREGPTQSSQQEDGVCGGSSFHFSTIWNIFSPFKRVAARSLGSASSPFDIDPKLECPINPIGQSFLLARQSTAAR